MVCLLLFGQQGKLNLKPGLKAPNIVLKGFLDSPEKRMPLLQFNGELLVIDFWNTTCSSCILAMPELDSLQKKFKDKISILLVTQNSVADVRKLFSRIKIRRPSLPILIGDSLLNKIFPHQGVPVHVWIGKDGVIKYITNGYNTTEKTVSSYLAGIDPHLHNKHENENFNFEKAMLNLERSSLLQNVLQYSSITSWIDETDGGGAGFVVDSARHQFGIRLVNATLLEFYKTAYGEAIGGGRFAYENYIALEVSRPEKFKYPGTSDSLDAWMAENIHSYDARIRNGRPSQIFVLMRRDLALQFPYSATVELRPIKSYVLVKLPGEDLLATRHPNAVAGSDDYKLVNKPFSYLLEWLQQMNYVLPYPTASEFNYDGNIDFTFPDVPSNHPLDFDTIRTALNNAGLDLVIKEKLQEMLIIRDR